MCGTMWREEPNEMRQLLKSVFRFVQMCHYLYVLVYEESLCAKIHIAYLARIVIIYIYIRVWMIKNKLKIKDSKTEFMVFRSPQAKQDLSGLSVSVDRADSQLYVDFSPCDEKTALANLQRCIQEVREWLRENFLLLNDKKN